MPANLTPQYREAEEKFRKARTPKEKQAALAEMLALIPKHKGTEKLQADLKRRMARLRNEEVNRSSKGRRANPFLVPPEGAAQIVLLGPPNCGKSSLLRAVTNAQPEVAEYPFTTRGSQPGMLFYEDVRFQLVDLPPITSSFFEPWIADLCRGADMAFLFADLASEDPLEGVEGVLNSMRRHHIHLSTAASEEGLGPAETALKTILLASRADSDREENLDLLRDLYGERFQIYPVSILWPKSLEILGPLIFESLSLIRVYTKVPGKDPDMTEPFVLPAGSTVLDVAAAVHKDFAKKLHYARLWGSTQFAGQRVQRDYIVQDRDVVELHV